MRLASIILSLLCLFYPLSGYATVIFQDNFDSTSDWTHTQSLTGDESSSAAAGARCTGCPTDGPAYQGYFSAMAAWSDYRGNNTLNIDNTNYRGASGKGLTFWMEPIDSTRCDGGTKWCSDGQLVVYTSSTYSDVYISYYIKFDPTYPWFEGVDAGSQMKINHVSHYDGSGGMFTFFKSGNHWPLNIPILREPGTGYSKTIGNAPRKQSCYYPNDGYSQNTNIVANDFYETNYNFPAVFGDGSWHQIIMRFRGNTSVGSTDGINTLWVDGTQIYTKTDLVWADCGTNSSCNTKCADCTGAENPQSFLGWNWFSFGGNTYNPYYSASTHTEHWYAIDDIIIATTYAEAEGEADTTAPTVTAAAISANGTTVTVTFDETVVTTGYDNGDFDMDCSSGGNGIALNSISGTGSTRTFTAAKTIYSGDTCNLDYTGTTDEIEDAAGNDLAAFSNTAVTNNSTQVIQAIVGGGVTMSGVTFR